MTRPTVEAAAKIDVRAMRRSGQLSSDATAVRMTTIHGSGADVRTHDWDIRLVRRTRGQIAGARLYFECPVCRRPRDLLFFRSAPHRGYACRTCQRLSYATENMTPVQRGAHKLIKLRALLGQQATSTLDPMPDKPKGMRWATYDRAIDRIAGEEDALFMRPMPRILSRLLNKVKS